MSHVEHDLTPRLGAAHQQVALGRLFERFWLVADAAGNQPTFASMTDPRPARPPDRNIAGLGEFEQALQRRIDGQVVLKALVGKDGRVHNAKAIRGNALLVSAALDAVSQWIYEPYRLNGEAVDMETQITINFKLP